ncbi:MAG: hypothetical protein EOO88_35945 [Pedobacter sp.]|nr:MAG: hypothetical protein EOO88_35945 [Pedobacter sp.]
MLPSEIQSVFDQYSESDYWLVAKKATWLSDMVLIFNLSVQDINGKGEINQNWILHAKGTVDANISFEWCRTLRVTEDDPLLWSFTDTYSELYISGKVESAPRLFQQLYQVHRDLYHGMIDFTLPAFESTFLAEISDFSSGLVAKGPKKLMLKYGVSFQKAGLVSNVIEQPEFLKAEDQSAERCLKAFILDKSFVIAREFEFRKALPDEF